MPEYKIPINKTLIHGELSFKLTGILFQAHNELGRFAKEKQYGDFIETKFKENNIPYKRELIIGDSGNIADFLVEDKIVLELKTKPFLTDADYPQIKRYLHACNLEPGILAHFREKALKPCRILNIKQNW